MACWRECFLVNQLRVNHEVEYEKNRAIFAWINGLHLKLEANGRPSSR